MELYGKYFRSKLARDFNSTTNNEKFSNPIRKEYVSRINKRKFDFVVSGTGLNVIALVKNLIKSGKSVLLLSENDLVEYYPNKLSNSPMAQAFLMLYSRKIFE
jgi:hypothetical protein